MCKSNPHFKMFHGAKFDGVFDMYALVEELRDKASELMHLYPNDTGPRPLNKLDEAAWVEFYFDRLFYRLTNRLKKQLPTAVDPSTSDKLENIVHQHKINKPQLIMVTATCSDLKRLLDRILHIGGFNPDGSVIRK